MVVVVVVVGSIVAVVVAGGGSIRIRRCMILTIRLRIVVLLCELSCSFE